MKKALNPRSAFFNSRVALALTLCLTGVLIALWGAGAQDSSSANTAAAAGAPAVYQMVGPVWLNLNLRDLPYVPPNAEYEEKILMRYPHGTEQSGTLTGYGISGLPQVQTFLKNVLLPAPTIPAPLLTFDGISEAASGCGCAPPDTNGDVGPNHYVQSVNSSFKIFNKSGATLSGPTTFNSFFASLVGTPCSNLNNGDPFVFYDQVADRWVISDFAFAAFPGALFYQCIGVSQTADPVAGGWYLYAIQVDPTNPTYLGDYPKFALWRDAYYFTVNLFSNQTTFNGVRVFALDRTSMLSGGAANTVAFTIPTAGLGDSYSLVAASFRTGTPPPAGRDEFLLAVDSPANENTSLTQVKAWKFHVDFATPGNSTLGVGANHAPNALITVNSFVEAWTNAAGTSIVPQTATTQKIDTLGDKIMTPVVYQNLGGSESLWADSTVLSSFPSGPAVVRWFQFDVTGGNFPATPVQQ